MFVNTSYFQKNGIMTEAVIEDIQGEDVWIWYSADNGNFSGPLGYYSSSMRVGNNVPIYYDLENPGRIHAVGSDVLTVIFLATLWNCPISSITTSKVKRELARYSVPHLT